MASLIGLSGKKLNQYLFPNGNPNYDFQIDHIIPLSKFNLKNRDHQLVALYYKNLQILPSLENLKKGASLQDNWKSIIEKICIERNIQSKKIINYIESVTQC